MENHPNSQSPLSIREIEIVKLLATGKTTKEIADELYLSEDTVKTHRKNIHHKANCSNSVELINYCRANNIITF